MEKENLNSADIDARKEEQIFEEVDNYYLYHTEELFELIRECMPFSEVEIEHMLDNALVDFLIEVICEKRGKRLSATEKINLENAVLSVLIDEADGKSANENEEKNENNVENKKVLGYVNKAIAALERADKLDTGDAELSALINDYKAQEQKYFSGQKNEADLFFDRCELEDEAKNNILEAIAELLNFDCDARNTGTAIESLKRFKESHSVTDIIKAYWALTLFDDGDAWI